MISRWRSASLIAVFGVITGGFTGGAGYASGGRDLLSYDYEEFIRTSEIRGHVWKGDDHGSRTFADVLSHAKRPFPADDPVLKAHETVHRMHFSASVKTKERDQFLYLADGLGVYVEEPRMHASHIRASVPERVKQIASSRYQRYLVELVDRSNPTVLYQFDEWNAYLIGSRVGVEMAEAGTWSYGYRDVIDGTVAFLYFASAALHALEQREPGYLEENTQFKAVFAKLAEDSARIIRRGLEYEKFRYFDAQKLWKHFLESEENQPIRRTLRDYYGWQWTGRVFGF